MQTHEWNKAAWGHAVDEGASPYTTGVLPWLRDLRRWSEIIAHFLKPGGIFYLVDDHPLMRTLRTNEAGELTVANPYFFSEELSPGLQAVRQAEAEAGLPMAQRICMRLDL